MFATTGTRKRPREDGEYDDGKHASPQDHHLDKRSRQAEGRAGDDEKWYHGHHDSVLSTPILTREQPQYESEDDRSSSVVSEPGSPQDVSMSSGEEMDAPLLSESPRATFAAHSHTVPRGHRLRTHRVATPIVSSGSSTRPMQRSSVHQHVRSRHPQEIASSDHLEVPSPIDEDEVPTPPSAAEAAGSQLSMLTVSDIDMDENELIPTISIEPARPLSRTTVRGADSMLDTVPELQPMDSETSGLVVRKQRQRSGALSSGNSPVRAGPSNLTETKLRGFSVGYRADCEKCRMRVPGHMNHFTSRYGI